MNLKVMPQKMLYLFSQKSRVKNLRYIFVSLTKSVISISFKSKRGGADRKQKSEENVLKAANLGTGSGMPVKIALPDVKLILIESITKKNDRTLNKSTKEIR
jgi:hypothetical protein